MRAVASRPLSRLSQQVLIEPLDIVDEPIEAEARDDRRARAFAHRPPARGSLISASMPAASPAPSLAGARTPTFAELTTSLTPPTSVLTTATPDAIASMIATGVPSFLEVSTNTSVAP